MFDWTRQTPGSDSSQAPAVASSTKHRPYDADMDAVRADRGLCFAYLITRLTIAAISFRSCAEIFG